MASRAPLLLIDGDSLTHRAYHGSRPLRGADGRPINALHGFAVMLLALVRTERPRAVLVCWDTLSVPTYRHRLWPAYQSGREFDAEIVEQLDRAPELVTAFGFAAAKAGGYEADDLLAAGARGEQAAGGTALVVTSDRDAYQLVTDRVTVLAPRSGAYAPDRIGPAEVVERYGVRPDQVPDFIALRGDPSDKLPGARGIGAKGAAELLGRYDSLEAIVEHAGGAAPAPGRGGARPAAGDVQAHRHDGRRRPRAAPADATLDVAGAIAHAERIGADRLADRLRRE